MVSPTHPGKFRRGHVAPNALVSRIVGLVVGVRGGIIDLFLMARHASLIDLVLRLEPISATGCVAMQAIEFSRLRAWAHEPGGVRVVFSKISAIRVVVRVFDSDQTKLVEESVPWSEGIC